MPCPGVAETHREVEPAIAARDDEPVADPLERDVPQPGGIVAVGGTGIDADDERDVVGFDEPEQFGPAGGVLREQQADRATTVADDSETSGDLA